MYFQMRIVTKMKKGKRREERERRGRGEDRWREMMERKPQEPSRGLPDVTELKPGILIRPMSTNEQC